MKCVRLIIAGLAVALAAALAPVAARADGVARTAAPIAQAPTSWSGLYFGVHTGYQWSNVNVQNPAFPPGFDAAGFARHAKEQFIRLQAAYDAGDRTTLADVMTPEMLDEIVRELDGSAQRRPTKVETLNAEVVDVETKGDQYWASVRFTGTLREADAAPVAFDEVWNLTKPADGSSGWLLAGIQQIA